MRQEYCLSHRVTFFTAVLWLISDPKHRRTKGLFFSAVWAGFFKADVLDGWDDRHLIWQTYQRYSCALSQPITDRLSFLKLRWPIIPKTVFNRQLAAIGGWIPVNRCFIQGSYENTRQTISHTNLHIKCKIWDNSVFFMSHRSKLSSMFSSLLGALK